MAVPRIPSPGALSPVPPPRCERGAAVAILAMALLVVTAGSAGASTPRRASAPMAHVSAANTGGSSHGRDSAIDPLPLLGRFETCFNGPDGMLIDPRYSLNPPEVARLSVVCQALGYYDLLLATGEPSYTNSLIERADFIVAHMDTLKSGSVFDGMLAYALLAAFDATGDSAYWNAATPIVEALLHASQQSLVLNWGLMGCMGLAKHYELTGDPRTLAKSRAIIDGLLRYQHADGSFPHYCTNSTDVHYTGWIGMELITIRHSLGYALIDTMLDRLDKFLRDRVCREGMTVYSEACPDRPGCFTNYYSFGTGCRQDYDTRAWTNELGYSALVFDHFGERHAEGVLTFLNQLTADGGFPDKWDYLPLASDPVYPFATSKRSIMRASVVFWSLAAMVRDRVAPPPAALPASWPDAEPVASDPELTAAMTERSERALRLWQWSDIDRLVLSGADMSEVCSTDVRQAPLAAKPANGASDPTIPRTCLENTPPGEEIALNASPNPTQDRAVVTFDLTRPALVELTVLDVSGRRVQRWTTWHPAGRYHEIWDLRDASGRRVQAGIYLIRIRGESESTAKVVVQP